MESSSMEAAVPQAAVQRLGWKETISYGTGDFASNLIWGTLSSFLLYFYTDVALLPVIAIGNIFLISRVLDAFIDPVVGSFVDRTNTMRGRTKPYIFFGVLPLCIFFVLSFWSPDASAGAKVAYAFATYIVVGILYSVVNIPYGALMSLMTRSPRETSRLSAARILGMGIGSILVTAATMPLVQALGGGDMQHGFTVMAILYSIVAIVCFGLILRNCQERNLPQREPQAYRLLAVYRKALANGPWKATIAFSFLIFCRIGAMVAITIFYCLHVLQNPALVSVLLPLMYVSALVSAPLTEPWIARFHYRKGNIIASIVFLAGFAVMPLFVEELPIFLGVYFVANVIGGISMGAVFGMVASSIDYNEWTTGKRHEGTLYAGYSFATKVGMAVGGAIIGYGLAAIGYEAGAVTDSVRSAMAWLYYLVPIVFAGLQIVAVSFYKLDAQQAQMTKELDEKKYGEI